MGIVNVTPDSFSDGGEHLDPAAAVAHACALAAEGADILDVGGESTRPGAQPVDAGEELRRVGPVLEGIAAALGAAAPQVSIDTCKAQVARAALARGASLVNDVSAFRADPEMAAVVAAAGADCCLMHMRGEPRTMQDSPAYEDVVDEVKAFLEERLEFALREGVALERIMLDPGIGFGKTELHNLELLRRLPELAELGPPDRRRNLPQDLSRSHRRARRRERASAGTARATAGNDRYERARARARREDLPRARRRGRA